MVNVSDARAVLACGAFQLVYKNGKARPINDLASYLLSLIRLSSYLSFDPWRQIPEIPKPCLLTGRTSPKRTLSCVFYLRIGTCHIVPPSVAGVRQHI